MAPIFSNPNTRRHGPVETESIEDQDGLSSDDDDDERLTINEESKNDSSDTNTLHQTDSYPIISSHGSTSFFHRRRQFGSLFGADTSFADDPFFAGNAQPIINDGGFRMSDNESDDNFDNNSDYEREIDLGSVRSINTQNIIDENSILDTESARQSLEKGVVLDDYNKSYDTHVRDIAFDPNLPEEKTAAEELAQHDPYSSSQPDIDSPYPEVRAAVPNVDDATLECNTLRMWVLGLFLTTCGAALNLIFSLHSPSFQISSFMSSILAWPLGKAWDKIVPNKVIFGVPLNAQPFNIKEHALITIMANVSFGSGPAYASEILVSMRAFYKVAWGWGFSLVVTLSTQMIGFTMAGMMRRLLVYPASMIWPANLVTCVFLYNIHRNINYPIGRWTVSRLRFFLYVTLAGSLYYFLPGYLAQFLSSFSPVVWIWPNNTAISQLFGIKAGLGFLPITFDWLQVTGYLASPLIPPVFATANIALALVVIYYIIAPIIHFTGAFYGYYVPMNDFSLYDRYQQTYELERVLTKKTEFDQVGYENYSPLFLPTSFVLNYLLSFASITATISHTALFHGQELWYYWFHSRRDPEDIHMRLMRKYPEVKEWWFLLFGVCVFGLCIVGIRVWPSELPVYGLVVALLLATSLTIPIGLIQAVTNQQVSLNVFAELIVGYMIPGKPIAMMLFKTFGYISMTQALSFVSDMKIGHYMKLPPRSVFIAQIVSSVWSCIVQVAVLQAMFEIPDLCQTDNRQQFYCSNPKVFYSASIIFGAIGPRRVFGDSGIYHILIYGFVIGAILPFASWLYLKRWPKSIIRYVHWPLFFASTTNIPPASPYQYGAYSVVGIFFNWFIKRRHFAWWAKYNYSLSAGLDLGLAIGMLLVFVILYVPNIPTLNWWGNTVVNKGLDANKEAFLIRLEPGQTFGPDTW